MEVDLKALTEATAGAVGGLLSTTLLYPLDTCKTKYQAEAKEGKERKYSSMLDVLREAIGERRPLSLYQGLYTKNVQSLIAGFVYFYSYSYVRTKYLSFRKKTKMDTGANLVVAAVAGACTAMVTQPLDTISARLQTSQPGASSSPIAMLRERGLSQAFDGLGASLLLTCNPAIQYTVFEQLRERLISRSQKRTKMGGLENVNDVSNAVAISAFSAFLLGAFSKTVATVLTYPLIRCKVMMQRANTEEEERMREAGDGEAGAPKNMILAFRVIWKTEGVSGFYKGLQGQILKTVLAAALMLMIKEKVGEGTKKTFHGIQKFLSADRNHRLADVSANKLRGGGGGGGGGRGSEVLLSKIVSPISSSSLSSSPSLPSYVAPLVNAAM